MFDPSSRYYGIKTLTLNAADGTPVRYVARRFLPAGESKVELTRVRLGEGNRLDLVAYQTLGDPLSFWRVADANNAMNPFDLTDEIDRELVIPVPEAGNR